MLMMLSVTLACTRFVANDMSRSSSSARRGTMRQTEMPPEGCQQPSGCQSGSWMSNVGKWRSDDIQHSPNSGTALALLALQPDSS
mmetsp:Transcript_17395/g.40475  ORF Transcript_17395/g.40475 Transcript_17395/m.40475 type:complete len:85 (+) Transcript_17395:2769-3023(+)